MKRFLTLLTLVLSQALLVFPQEQLPEEGLRCRGPKVTRADLSPASDAGAWVAADAARDGITSLTYCLLFKEGQLTVKRISPAEVGALPVGFTLYKDLAFDLSTRAIVAGPHLISLRIPSVASEETFKKLSLLFLGEDDMNPGKLRWEWWMTDFKIPAPDFKGRRLDSWVKFYRLYARVTNKARVVVATFDRAAYERLPVVDLEITNVEMPPRTAVGENITSTIKATNKGPGVATGVVLNHSLHGHQTFLSASASRGVCRRSEKSSDVAVCELGTIQPGQSVVVSVVSKVGQYAVMDGYEEGVLSSDATVRAEEREENIDNNRRESSAVAVRRRP